MLTNKIKYILMLLLYRLLSDVSYEMVIEPVFGYSGFVNEVSVLGGIVSYILLIVFGAITYPWKISQGIISRQVLYFLFLLNFIPFTSMVMHGLKPAFVIANTVFWLFLVLFDLFFPKRKRFVKSGMNLPRKMENQIPLAALFVSALCIVFVSYKFTGFRINLDFQKVYDLRAEARAYVLPGWLSYLFGWTRAVNTLLIAYYYRKKKRFLSLIVFTLQILSYGIDGSKAVFFYSLCALSISAIPRLNIKRINDFTLDLLCAFTLLGLLQYFILGEYSLIGMITRRVMYTPVRLEQDYFDFFTTHVPDFYRGSFLKYFGFKSPYSHIANMIGEVYYQKPEMAANNGLMSDGICNLGYLGIIVSPMLIIWILRELDISTNGLDSRVKIVLALYSCIPLINSFLITVLITHGMLVLIILLRFMKSNRRAIEQRIADLPDPIGTG